MLKLHKYIFILPFVPLVSHENLHTYIGTNRAPICSRMSTVTVLEHIGTLGTNIHFQWTHNKLKLKQIKANNFKRNHSTYIYIFVINKH